MKAWLATVAFAATTFAAALPAPGNSIPKMLLKRVVSPDGTCGGSNGYTCPAGTTKCCSQWGWCGDTAEFCGTGCQPAFGSCSGGGSTPTPTPTPTPPPSTGGRPKVGNVPYGANIYTCTRPGFVALTFDDGPHVFTSGLLDILKANGVVATFFLNGKNWGDDDIYGSTKSALVQRMIAEGHQVGSHTWSHADLDTLSPSGMTSEMTQLESAFLSIIGKYPTYMRPPYFSCSGTCQSNMGNLGYHVINTDLDTLDWQNNTPSTIQNSKNIFANAINSADPASRGFIPLTHDVHSTTVNSLVQYMIDTLKSRGFKATTVGWCLNDHSSNWYRTTQ
ncbi:hypothetical protein FN846DRAFT_685514 [Sphaerosporella brunnea]|uniref:Glycoside hydrolase/deacetylase n=1 Tax=Sphaerosporella brunnea TaxID=1250544 RepID=A0A5J5EZ42_9PEZI|nr:hypothetical protein FN846DRAFT_685514 [Sphaerosporella brunnea]